VLAGKRADQPVDTGFIVFNHATYPNLVALFDKLGVPTAKSCMSFGASLDGGRLEYGLKNLRAVFAQRRNLANPRYLRMLRDIFRFNAQAEAVARPGMTIGELLRELGTGPLFRDGYILPLSGAIWSTPVQGITDFPAQALLTFFRNHALLTTTRPHQWYTVPGGSIEYVRRLEAAMIAEGVDLRLGAPIAGVKRAMGGAFVRPVGGDWEAFDEVVFATHSDDTLAMLEDPAPAERAALSRLRYQPNEAVLHADPSLMPKRKAAWASWNYVEPNGPRPEKIDLTYWMNSLQPIPHDDPLFVTLNTNKPIRPDLIHDVATFRHPVYDLAAEEGRAMVRSFNGDRGTWFCGAWMRNGFHEDGFASAVDVVEGMRTRVRLAA
jgi:uncharacterized protein